MPTMHMRCYGYISILCLLQFLTIPEILLATRTLQWLVVGILRGKLLLEYQIYLISSSSGLRAGRILYGPYIFWILKKEWGWIKCVGNSLLWVFLMFVLIIGPYNPQTQIFFFHGNGCGNQKCLQMLVPLFGQWLQVKSFSCIDRIFWCDQLFLNSGPNQLLGSQTCNRHTGSYSCNRIVFGRVIARKCQSRTLHLDSFYSLHTCITSTYCCIYVNALPNDT